MRANITISNWKSPDREERKYHMYVQRLSKVVLECSIFFEGQAKMMKNEVLNLENGYFYTNQILFYQLLL